MIVFNLLYSIFRLYEKFTIHSETEAGERLKQKVHQFLELPAFEKKDVSKVGADWLRVIFSSAVIYPNVSACVKRLTKK